MAPPDAPPPDAAEVLCVGEVLWDALPAGLFLGGAPYNVACHLRAQGRRVAFASRVGDDRLGREARRRMRQRGLADDLVQTDDAHETGFVEVALDAAGTARYTIVEPVAWDALAPDAALTARAERAAALVYGTLAQRSAATRATLQALWTTPALKVYDVNLRPPFADPALVAASLAAADVVKLNDDEVATLSRWWDLPAALPDAAAALAQRFGCTTVCVTRGGAGAGLWHAGAWHEHPGYDVVVADTVGAGDAFLARLLGGLLDGMPPAPLLAAANRLGAYVAARPGATPAYDGRRVDELPLAAR